MANLYQINNHDNFTTGGEVCAYNIVCESSRVSSKTEFTQIRCEFIIDSLFEASINGKLYYYGVAVIIDSSPRRKCTMWLLYYAYRLDQELDLCVNRMKAGAIKLSYPTWLM